MAISVPAERCYYVASPVEIDRILCWLPPGELWKLANSGQISPTVIDDYPSGLEIEVSDEQFALVALQLHLTASQIHNIYSDLRSRNLIALDGIVRADDLETYA